MTLTTALNFAPSRFIDVVTAGPSLQPGFGVHRLVLPWQFSAGWLDREDEKAVTPALFTGAVWTQSPSYSWLGNTVTEAVMLRGYPRQYDLVVSVSDDQLIALEKVRGGSDLILQVKLRATLLRAEDFYPHGEVDVSVHVTADEWRRLLDQLGREVGVVVRVPSPLSSVGAPTAKNGSVNPERSLTRAAARLREARDDLRDARYPECVVTCRRVLEILGELAPTIPSQSRLNKISLHDRAQDERWAAIYWSARQLANAAPHEDPKARTFMWERVDAEALLATTASLLVRWTTPFAAGRSADPPLDAAQDA